MWNLYQIPHSDSGAHHGQHSYPVLVARRPGRRLPPTPCKPSTLQLKPTNINFPKLNASPTHVSLLSGGEWATPNCNPIFQTLLGMHNTPHSVHSLPHSRDFSRENRDIYFRERDRFRDRDYGLRYEFRDREREAYEREREIERELERDFER